IHRALNLEQAGLMADAIQEYRLIYSRYKAGWAARAITRLTAFLLPEPNPAIPIKPRPAAQMQPGALKSNLRKRDIGGDDIPVNLDGIEIPDGETYALLIGISNYPKSSGVSNLMYAEADAKLFRGYLESARGGRVKNIETIDSRNATAANIRAKLADLVRGHGGRKNTLLLYVAAHGFYGCVDDNGVPALPPCRKRFSEPFLLTTD